MSSVSSATEICPSGKRSDDVEQENLADLYHTKPIPWSRALKQLEAATAAPDAEEPAWKTTWLSTTRADGRPHAAAVTRPKGGHQK
jgi:hypothetical protein